MSSEPAVSERRGRRVVVVGSINVDYVLSVKHRPQPGETVGDAVLEFHGGGKGANQAVAVAKTGALIKMVGRVGTDAIGRSRIAELDAKGVDTEHVLVTPDTTTGIAVVILTPDGENEIIVAPGANALLSENDVEVAAPAIKRTDVLLTQLEVPMATVARAIALAGVNTTVIMNCAPFRPPTPEMLERTDVLVVNEVEARALAGQALDSARDAERIALALCHRGPRAAVITLGADGAVVATGALVKHVPAPPVDVVDTTGAGDAFVGAFAGRFDGLDSVVDAVAFGVAVGSATTEYRGAEAMIPAALGNISSGTQLRGPGMARTNGERVANR